MNTCPLCGARDGDHKLRAYQAIDVGDLGNDPELMPDARLKAICWRCGYKWRIKTMADLQTKEE